MSWWSNQGQDSQWHPEKVFLLLKLDGAVWPLHCFPYTGLWRFIICTRSSALHCSIPAAQLHIPAYACMWGVCVHVHPSQNTYVLVLAVLFYFTFKILTSWIKCFNRRVEIKLFKLIENLKLHISLSIVSSKLVQLMTESKLVPRVYTCNFNNEAGKAGGFRVWG